MASVRRKKTKEQPAPTVEQLESTLDSDGFRSVFHDFCDPEEARDLEQRTCLLIAIQEHIKKAGYTQAEVSKITGLHQPDVSCLLNTKVSKFKIDRLVKIARKFDADVKVTISFPESKVVG